MCCKIYEIKATQIKIKTNTKRTIKNIPKALGTKREKKSFSVIKELTQPILL